MSYLDKEGVHTALPPLLGAAALRAPTLPVQTECSHRLPQCSACLWCSSFKHVFADYNYKMRAYQPSRGSMIEHASWKQAMYSCPERPLQHSVVELYVSLSFLIFKLRAGWLLTSMKLEKLPLSHMTSEFSKIVYMFTFTKMLCSITEFIMTKSQQNHSFAQFANVAITTRQLSP